MGTYRVVNDFRTGMPQTPTGTVGPFRMIALHDTEGGVGDGGALGTIRYLIDNSERNASYHEIWAWDEGARIFTVRRIVPATSAAHSMNPFPPTYAPDPWVRQALGDRWQDPNRVIYAVSLAGRVADVNRWSGDSEFVSFCKRRIGEIQDQFNVVTPYLGEHFRMNPSTRSDWGRLLTPALGGLDTRLETLNMEMRPVQEEWWTRIGSVFYTAGPGMGIRKTFTLRMRLPSIAESVDGNWRMIPYGSEILWFERDQIDAIAGTRLPTSGFAWEHKVETVTVTKTVEVPTGITQAQLAAAVTKATNDGVAAEKSRLRAFLGL